MKMKYLGFVLILLSSSVVFAGDYANLRFVGFSKDGQYMAFEESGEWDVHSGGDYANTYFIDVEKNAYAVPPITYDWSENMDRHTGRYSQNATLARYKAAVAAAMRRFRIVPGNTGQLVAAHLISDHSFERSEKKSTQFMQADDTWVEREVPSYEGQWLSPDYDPNTIIFNPTYYPVNPNNEDFYELKLKTLPSPKPCDARGNPTESPMLEMTLTDHTHHTDLAPQVLQRDKTLPAVRGCVTAYTIEQVYFYNDNLAIFINVYTPGFPSSSMRYMAVTGRLEYESNPKG